METPRAGTESQRQGPGAGTKIRLGSRTNKENSVRYLKILAVSAVAAAAMMAVVGAGTASAKTILCTGNPPGTTKSSECPAGVHEWTWPAPQKIKAHAVNPVLETSLVNVECNESATEVEPSSDNSATTIAGKVTALSFTGCHIQGSTTACTVTVENLPYTGSIEGTVGGKTESSKLSVNNPRAKVVCGSFINCTYSQASVSLAGTNGLPTQFVANTSLANVGGLFCPSTSTWKATYKADSTITIH